MSVAMLNLCWDLQLPQIEKAVLISLADQANDQGECWPSLETVKRRTCLSERSLQRAFASLERRGYLRRSYRPGHSTRYLLPTVYPSQVINTPVTVTPRHTDTPVTVTPTPVIQTPPPPSHRRDTPVTQTPRTVIEPSVEPSRNRVHVRNFVPPTLDQVTSYVQEKRLNVDASKFVDHYISNGWKVGRNPMKDWQAACRTWHRMHDDLPRSAIKGAGWWESETETNRIASSLGMSARGGESWKDFRSRIRDKIKENQ